ncbi:MAG: molybdopterin-binding protein, partial [Raoultibacter sp.]
LLFEGWADDFDKKIDSVEFSLDGGISWTNHSVQGSDAIRWVWWTFEWTPLDSGVYTMFVRSVNEDGKASPCPASHVFEVL